MRMFRCISLVYFALSASHFFQHMLQSGEGKTGKRRKHSLDVETNLSHSSYIVVRGITCTHDDDVDDRNPKTAFFWDMLVGYHRQINMH